MKVAHITPTPLLEKVLHPKKDNYHLVLTNQIINDEAYREFYKDCISRGHYVILDNDAHELKGAGQMMKIDMLNEAIDLLGPSEVVLPDRFGDGMEATIAHMEEGLEKLRKGSWKWQAVPRGLNYKEYIACVKRVLSYKEVSCLGIYYLTVKELGVKRRDNACTVATWATHLIRGDIKIHLLGEGADLRAMRDAEHMPAMVRGLDTAKIVNWGLEGKPCSANHVPPHSGRTHDYFAQGEDLDEERLKVIKDNIMYWRWYCGRVQKQR